MKCDNCSTVFDEKKEGLFFRNYVYNDEPVRLCDHTDGKERELELSQQEFCSFKCFVTYVINGLNGFKFIVGDKNEEERKSNSNKD